MIITRVNLHNRGQNMTGWLIDAYLRECPNNTMQNVSKRISNMAPMTWVGSAKGSDFLKLILDKIFKLSDRYLENFKRTVGETEIIWANENQGQPLISSFVP